MKKLSKRFLKILLIFLILGSLFACNKTKESDTDIKRITVIIIGLDPASYFVYDVDAYLKVTRYNLSYSWMNDDFSFFTDSLPPKSEYESESWTISEDKWKEVITAINDNDFLSLPVKLKGAEVTDYVSYYISVEGRNFKHSSGGYAVDIGKNDECKRFTKVLNIALEAFKN